MSSTLDFLSGFLVVQVLSSRIRDSYQKEAFSSPEEGGSSRVCGIGYMCRQNSEDVSPDSCTLLFNQTLIWILLGRDFADLSKIMIGRLSWFIQVGGVQSHDIFKVAKFLWIGSERCGRRQRQLRDEAEREAREIQSVRRT